MDKVIDETIRMGSDAGLAAIRKELARGYRATSNVDMDVFNAFLEAIPASHSKLISRTIIRTLVRLSPAFTVELLRESKVESPEVISARACSLYRAVDGLISTMATSVELGKVVKSAFKLGIKKTEGAESLVCLAAMHIRDTAIAVKMRPKIERKLITDQDIYDSVDEIAKDIERKGIKITHRTLQAAGVKPSHSVIYYRIARKIQADQRAELASQPDDELAEQDVAKA